MAQKFTDTRPFAFSMSNGSQYRALTVSDAGTVTIGVHNGEGYIISDTITINGSYPVFVSGVQLEITPSGGAGYSWGE